jgi:hypothetical protein
MAKNRQLPTSSDKSSTTVSPPPSVEILPQTVGPIPQRIDTNEGPMSTEQNAATQPVDDGLRTPREHAIALRHVKPSAISLAGRAVDARDGYYCAAEYIHGWATHNQHSATPLRISLEDYKGAIKAAQTADEAGGYTPHAPACSPFSTYKK